MKVRIGTWIVTAFKVENHGGPRHVTLCDRSNLNEGHAVIVVPEATSMEVLADTIQ